MKKKLIIIIGLLLSCPVMIHAQVARKLRELGLENIRTAEAGEQPSLLLRTMYIGELIAE